MMKKVYYSLLFVSLVFLFSACGKEDDQNALPGYVNFEVNVNLQDRELASPTNFKQFTQPRLAGESVGYSGLLLVCSGVPVDGASYFYLYAYDLCCRYENRRDVRIIPQSDGLTAKCPSCGSVYNIFNGVGSVISGPSENNLQRYQAVPIVGGNGVFRVIRNN